MPTTTPLTDAINALTTYANETTGASDTDLSSAVATLVAGYGGGGGSDPYLYDGNITIADGSIDIKDNNKAVINNNSTTRRSVLALTGDSKVQWNGSPYNVIDGLHLLEIPSGALSVRLTIDRTCQFAVREYVVGSDGKPTSSVATTGWLDITANVGGTAVSLTNGMTHLGISLRVNSTGSATYSVFNRPYHAKVEFLKQ